MSRLPSLLPRRRAAAGRMRSPKEIRALTPPFTSERSAVPAAVAAEQEWPRLRIWRGTYRWMWAVFSPSGVALDFGRCSTHGEALGVGLAALEQASAGWRL